MSKRPLGGGSALSVKRVKPNEMDREVFEERGGLSKKPKGKIQTLYEHLKKDAVEKKTLASQYSKEIDTWGVDRQLDAKQLPTDASGKLPDWQPDTPFPNGDPKIGNDYVCVVVGKRRTGKTWIARHLLHKKRQVFNHGLVITKTKFNGFWQNYFPASVVHGTFDPTILEQFMLLSLEIEEHNRENPARQINNRSVIVLDDVIADKHVRYDDTLATLFYNGRHFGIFLIICSQYVFGLPPGLRSNADLVFVLRQFQNRQRKQLSEDYADMLDNPEEFTDAININTENNGCVVIDISSPSRPIQEMFYSWKAEDPGLFEIGSYVWKKQVWNEGEEEDKAAYTFD